MKGTYWDLCHISNVVGDYPVPNCDWVGPRVVAGSKRRRVDRSFHNICLPNDPSQDQALANSSLSMNQAALLSDRSWKDKIGLLTYLKALKGKLRSIGPSENAFCLFP